MNRYLEHDGMKRGLKSQDCAKVLKAVQGYIPDNWHTCFQEVKGALQAADYIALAEKHAPYTKAEKYFHYELLSRLRNEWCEVTRAQWLELYNENPKRVCTSRTYGPTLRIKYPCGYVGFKGIPEGPTALSGILSATNYKPVVPKKEFGVELTPKRKAQDVRSDKYLEVCGRGLRRLDASSISITYVRSKNRLIPMFERVDAEPEPESKASKPNLRKYKTLGFSGRGKPLVCMACGKDNCVELRQAQEEWEKFHAEPQPEPIKPEQLDPKACRQFVEQLLAFDELEKNRTADSWQFLVTLLSNPYIGVLSYLTFLEAYKK